MQNFKYYKRENSDIDEGLVSFDVVYLFLGVPR